MSHINKTIAVLLVLVLVPLAHAAERNNVFSLKLVNTQDDVAFDIASDISGENSPNVLSELSWDDLELWHLQGSIRYGIGDHFKIIGDFGIGVIVDGDVTDSDFLGDNRTGEFSRATASVDGKHHTNLALGIGWEFRKDFEVKLWRVGDSKRMAFASDIQITPQIGYGYTKQEIEFEDGVQIIPDLGAFGGLNSSYDPEWRGIFIGVDSRFRVYKNFFLSVNARYWPDLNYKAEANWNLRDDFSHPRSFVQSADADGIDAELGVEWVFGGRQSVSLSYYMSDYSTDSGSDEVITSQGISFFTRLNEASWEKKGWSLAYEWRF